MKQVVCVVPFVLALIPCVHNAKILGVFLFPSYSHQKVFQPICRELSLRGHEVTVFTTLPLKNPDLKNLTEFNISFKHDNRQHAPKNFLSKEINMFEDLHNIFNYVNFIVKTALNDSHFENFVLNHTENFDLILLECLHPALYDLSRKFKAPIICVSSLGALTVSQDVVGNPSHPTLFREFFVTCHEKNLPVWQKTHLFLLNLWSRFWYSFVIRPHGRELTKTMFGPDTVDLIESEKNVRMFFLNVNLVLYDPRPNVPAVLELGLMGMKLKEPLPDDLQNFLDDAKHGAIYCSLGTVVHIEGSSIGQTILEGLAKLPYKVLIKWKCDALLHKYGNILCKDWLPQNDVLEHPNLKVFITQGGLHSIEEAVYAGVPLLCLPFMVDQPMNSYKIAQLGIGKQLDPATITADELRNTIVEVADTNKYRVRMLEVRNILLDRPVSSLEKAVWWTEYIIRHKEAWHVRSFNADISWLSYLMADVLLVLIGTVLLTIVSFCYVLRILQ